MLIPADDIGIPVVIPNIIDEHVVDYVIPYNNTVYHVPPQTGDFCGVYAGYAFFSASPNYMICLTTLKSHNISYRGDLVVYTRGILITNEFITTKLKLQ